MTTPICQYHDYKICLHHVETLEVYYHLAIYYSLINCWTHAHESIISSLPHKQSVAHHWGLISYLAVHYCGVGGLMGEIFNTLLALSPYPVKVRNVQTQQEPLLLTWISFNPSMDK